MKCFRIVVKEVERPGQRLRLQLSENLSILATLPLNSKPGMIIRFTKRSLNENPSLLFHSTDELESFNLPETLRYEEQIEVRPKNHGDPFRTELPKGVHGDESVVVNLTTRKVIVPVKLQFVLFRIDHKPNTVVDVLRPDESTLKLTLPPEAKPNDLLLIDSVTGIILNLYKPGELYKKDKSMKNMKNLKKSKSMRSLKRFTSSKRLPARVKKVSRFPKWEDFKGHTFKPLPFITKDTKDIPPTKIVGMKKALLVGINYRGTAVQLNGCNNDVTLIRRFLVKQGFKATSEHMVCLVDDTNDKRYTPTRANIIKGIQWLIKGVSAGDTLFLHYSGHGAQLRDDTGREPDGKNEAICPVDFLQPDNGGGLITDDELWDLCSVLPYNCRLYCLFDCCHSGSGVDLSFFYKDGKGYEHRNPNYCVGDIIMFSGCKDQQSSAESWQKQLDAPVGVMTNSFIDCYERNPEPLFSDFMRDLTEDIKRKGFLQVPQLSSSQIWNPVIRHFQFDGGIASNTNSAQGKVKEKHYTPRIPDMRNSPLGELLLLSGYEVLASPTPKNRTSKNDNHRGAAAPSFYSRAYEPSVVTVDFNDSIYSDSL